VTDTLVIILNWRGADMTVECIDHVTAMGVDRADILVVENGSHDGSLERIRALDPPVRILPLDENLGFAGGVNAGLRTAADDGYRFALLMNNDAVPRRDTLERLREEWAEDVALLAPSIVHREPGDRVWISGGSLSPRLLEPRRTGEGSRVVTDGRVVAESEILYGTCLLVNLRAVAECGPLDDRLFLYYEDLDWSIRFRDAGFRLLAVKDAVVWHEQGTSVGGLHSETRQFHMARSSVIFYRLHGHRGRPVAIFLFRLVSGLKQLGGIILRGRFRSAGAYLRGIRAGFRQVLSD